MKKLLCIILSVLTLCGCTHKVTESDKLNIVTTVFASYDFAKEIAKDKANVSSLIKPGIDVHSFEPSPKDIIEIENCDVFIYTGGDNEKWVEKILKTIKKDFYVVKMLDVCDIIQEENHSHHNHNEGTDQHVWTSPVNAVKISKAIKEAMIKVDEENKSFYENNYKDYEARLNKLDAKIKDCVAQSKRKEVIFGDRFPVIYFTNEYKINHYSAFSGCSAESEADARTVAFLCEKITEEKIPAVFYIEMSDKKMAKAISEATGAKCLLFHSCHNVTLEEFNNGATYISLMEQNLSALKEALN